MKLPTSYRTCPICHATNEVKILLAIGGVEALPVIGTICENCKYRFVLATLSMSIWGGVCAFSGIIAYILSIYFQLILLGIIEMLIVILLVPLLVMLLIVRTKLFENYIDNHIVKKAKKMATLGIDQGIWWGDIYLKNDEENF